MKEHTQARRHVFDMIANNMTGGVKDHELFVESMVAVLVRNGTN